MSASNLLAARRDSVNRMKCSIDGCNQLKSVRNYCGKHAKEFSYNGGSFDDDAEENISIEKSTSPKTLPKPPSNESIMSGESGSPKSSGRALPKPPRPPMAISPPKVPPPPKEKTSNHKVAQSEIPDVRSDESSPTGSPFNPKKLSTAGSVVRKYKSSSAEDEEHSYKSPLSDNSDDRIGENKHTQNKHNNFSMFKSAFGMAAKKAGAWIGADTDSESVLSSNQAGVEVMERLKQKSSRESIAVPHGGVFVPFCGNNFVFDVEQMYSFGRSTPKQIEIRLNTLIIAIVSRGGETKRYPIVSVNKIDAGEDGILKLSMTLELESSGKDGTRKKNLRFTGGNKERDEFISIIKDLKKSGLLSQRVFNDYIEKAGAFNEKTIKDCLIKAEVKTDHNTIRMFYESLDCNNSGGIDYYEFIRHFSQNPSTSMEIFLVKAFNIYAEASKMVNDQSTVKKLTSPHPSIILACEPFLKEYETVLDVCDKAIFNNNNIFIQGCIFLTNYRFIFVANKNAVRDSEYGALGLSPLFEICEVPILSISRIENNNTSSSTTKAFTLHCKDFRVLDFAVNATLSWLLGFLRVLRMLSFPDAFEQFAYAFARPFLSSTSTFDYINGWDLYNLNSELIRQGLFEGKNSRYWKEVDNSDFKLSPTYGKSFVVPSNISAKDIENVCSFRSKARLPAVTWFHKTNKCVLTRASQPMVGITSSRSESDEILCEFIRLSSNIMDRTKTLSMSSIDATKEVENFEPHLYIIDARSTSAAEANRMRKGGHENINNYVKSSMIYMNIDNIHVMRESVHKLVTACVTDGEDLNFFAKLDSSGWFKHVHGLLKGAVRIAEILELEKQSVLTHCSDGWDRTAQLCALAEILLDPFYRTIEGLAVLIEKDWCSFGHKFQDRIGHGDANFLDQERSPVFLQWIECVWQVSHQYPKAMEFNEKMLIFICDSLYSCQFGTFLYNTEKERENTNVKNKTESIWTHILKNKKMFTNPDYETNNGVIWPCTSQRMLKLWEGYYLRFDPEYSALKSKNDKESTLNNEMHGAWIKYKQSSSHLLKSEKVDDAKEDSDSDNEDKHSSAKVASHITNFFASKTRK